MPKAKLKISSGDAKKLRVAAEFSRVTLLQDGSKKVGNDLFITASTPDPANFFELGKMFSAVTGTELDEDDAKKKEDAKKK